MTEKTEALRLADLWEKHSHGYARTPEARTAAELRRLSAENETLKQSVALLQQHHATAWNRGHAMGMKANEDTARRALDAVKQDAWGNTQLTEALLKAEAQRDALLEALKLARPYISTYALDGYHAEVKADAAIKAVEGENT